MDKDQLVKQLMATFLEELQEHVRALNRDLLALEQEPAETERAERFTTLLRTVHSLKGAARSVNVTVIEGACHRLEETLGAARDGRVPLDPDLFGLLFATADAVEEAGLRLRGQQDLTETRLAALLPRLEAAAGPTGEQAHAPVTSASAFAALREDRQARAEDQRTNGEVQGPNKEDTVSESPLLGPQSSAHPADAAGTLTEPASSAGTVRVAAEKLDTFLGRSGELLVARRRVESRAEDVVALHEFMRRWRAEWQSVEKTLGKRLPQKETANGNGKGLPAQEKCGRSGLFPRHVALVLGRVGKNLRRLEKDLERLAMTMAADARLLDHAGRALDNEVRRVRMLPFAEACQGLDRMVRDLAQADRKEVDFVVEGGDVELDRSVLEGLKDPLRHLVRNAVDHGAEPGEERRAVGKPFRTRITVAAVLRGSQVDVIVADDGRGLDLEALRQQARKKRLPESGDERELARLVFLPGISTSRMITDVSGRGVGLDVVKSRVEALHGTVDLSFRSGHGTRFTLALPLTLTTLRAVLVMAGGQTYALVSTNVQKLMRVDPAEIRSVEGREMLALGGTPLPVASLAETLGLRGREPTIAGGKAPALILAAGEKRMAFVVDEFLAEQEIVIKRLGPRFRRVRYVSGATLLPSGRIVLVLNAANLLRSALGRAPERALAGTLVKTVVEAKKRVLLAEDSITTRTLVKSILEVAGYEVMVAVDGAAAWQLLQERGADILVSDVEMPRMSGFALIEAVRGSKRFHELPVVLVTALHTEQDKARGLEVGADAYLVKSAFDQKNLLEIIAQLL